MPGRPRVILLSNLFPTPADPTRGIFTLQIAREMAASCQLTVVCPLPWFLRLPNWKVFRPYNRFSLVPGEYEVEGIRVVSPKYPLVPYFSEWIHPLLMFPTLYAAVRAIVRRTGCDAINVHWLYPDGVAASWIGQRLRVPVVQTALGSDVNIFFDEAVKPTLIVRALRRARRVTTVSEDLKRRIAAAGIPAANIEVIPNGVNTERFAIQDRVRCRRQLGLPEDRKIITFVGRLVEVKGVIHLLEAAARLRAIRKDFLVCLVGDGPKRAEYEAIVAGHTLGEHVRFAGNQGHGDIPAWLGAGDLLCLPSLAEGGPNVVLEALAAGRPVVASRVGGIPDMVNESNGALVAPADPARLAEALARALDTSWDAEALRRTVLPFSWARAAARYLEAAGLDRQDYR